MRRLFYKFAFDNTAANEQRQSRLWKTTDRAAIPRIVFSSLTGMILTTVITVADDMFVIMPSR